MEKDLYSGILLRNRVKVTMQTTTWMNTEKSHQTKETTHRFSLLFYDKCLKKGTTNLTEVKM